MVNDFADQPAARRTNISEVFRGRAIHRGSELFIADLSGRGAEQRLAGIDPDSSLPGLGRY